MPPCNCGKKSRSTTYVYTSKDGQKQKFATEVEAKAAQIRAGGGGVVQAV